MKKPKFLDQIIGAIYILLSLYFVNTAGNSPSPVDEFNIYWMFTLSAMGLGGFLVVTNSENKLIHWGTRIILLFTAVFPVYLVTTKELGAAWYFPWIFLVFAVLVLIQSLKLERGKSNVDVLDDGNFQKNIFGFDHKKAVIFISRIFVGSLFIVSGLIKANDPLGFSYKLEEYFTDTALGPFWSTFFSWSLFLAIFISAIEILLGLAVLFGGKSKLTAWTLLSMALFFAWLTWFTATCVDDQTAFGDKHMKESTQLDEEFKPQYEKLAKDYEGYYEYIGDTDDNFSEEELVIIKEIRNKVANLDSIKGIKEKELGEFTRTCVDDCGCFGDAMKGSVGRSLTPWESFYKDICLLFFVLILLLHAGEIKLNKVMEDVTILPISLLIIALFSGGLFDWMFPFYFTFITILIYWLLKKYPIKKIGADWTIAIAMFLISLFFTLYCLWYLPIKDFRPYAIGKNLIEQRKTVQPELQFYYTLKNKKSGEVKEFDKFPENWDADWDYVSSRNVVIKEGVDAPAKDFSITEVESGKDRTDSILNLEDVFILVAYDLSHSNLDAFQEANEIAKAAKKEGILFICLTSSDPKSQAKVKNDLKLDFDFYYTDDKVQKAIIRSNPGLILLNKAQVINKWSSYSLPDFETIKKEYLK